ncbi:MAG: lamin tail domain-containing protein [Candidatus Pacebacteria bacterium]|nr:lamin tail domain-containing protein [Candidatus Paceibacterota bacterium]
MKEGQVFFSQNGPGSFSFLNTIRHDEVLKKTIIRACAGDCQKIYTRSYGIGNPLQQWEIEFVFDDPDLVFDKDSGQYARGVGMNVPWFLSPTLFGNNPFGFDLSGFPDSVWLENYSVNARKRELSLPTILNPEGFSFPEIPDHWDYTQATILFYYNNVFIEELTGEVRPNGNGRLHVPLKGWKVKLHKSPKTDIPFARTGNFVLRTQTTFKGTIEARITSEITNLWSSGLKVSRTTDQGALSVYNGAFLENFGMYGIFEASDKRYAKENWMMRNPEQLLWVNASDGAEFLFPSAHPESDPSWRALVKDTQWVYSRPRDSLELYVDAETWIKYAAHKAFIRPNSSWHREQKVFYDQGGRSPKTRPVIKDDDSAFSHQNLQWNHIATFVSGDSAWGGTSDAIEYIDLFPHWALRASLMHPERRHYYQNIMLDGFEMAMRYSKTKPVFDRIVTDFWTDYSIFVPVHRLNNSMDSLMHIYQQESMDVFLQNAPIAYLRDWIEFFHSGYTLADTFNVRIVIDQEIDDCGIYPGSVRVNSMQFISDGSRIHVRDYPLEIEAIPSPGYTFSHWEQNTENQSFMLIHEAIDDVWLTPVFIKEYSACEGREELIINEVLPWHAELPDLIEIYNPTYQDIILDGMYISDRSSVLKHQFIDAVIPAQGFLVIQAGGSPSDNADYYVSEFSLSKNGEAVYLFDADSVLVHYVEWGAVEYPLSYGYCNNQKTDGAIFSMEIMTLGKPNECLEDTVDTSIDFVETYNIKVYPNPASSHISVTSDIQIHEIRILNLQGAYVYTSSEYTFIDVSFLSSGVYFVEIQTPIKKEYVKFIKD